MIKKLSNDAENNTLQNKITENITGGNNSNNKEKAEFTQRRRSNCYDKCRSPSYRNYSIFNQ